MSKPKSPLFSLDAHGTIADTLTFQKRSGADFVRTKPIPTDPQSASQLAQRDAYQHAASSWHDLTDTQKAAWNMSARPLRITGFNLYMRYLLKLINSLSNRWAFMEGSGLATHDSWGDAAPATIIGAGFISSKWGYALDFDGLDDRVLLPTPATMLISSEDFSLIARLKQLSTPGDQTLLFNITWNTSGFRVRWRNDNRWAIDKYRLGVGQDTVSQVMTVPFGEWFILGITRQGNNVKFFINGLDKTAWNNINTDFVPAVTPTEIGSRSFLADFYKGDMDFILWFYNTELTPTQMLDWAERTL